MVCIYCCSPTSVTNSRHRAGGLQTWRRRRCSKCRNVFTTREVLELEGSLAIEHHGAISPFARDELFLMIHDSLKHRKTATKDATALTETVLRAALPVFQNGSAKKDHLNTVIIEILDRFDPAAAVHYRAYYSS